MWWYEPREVLPTLAVTHQVTLPTTKPEQFLLKASRSMERPIPEKRTGIYRKGTGTAFGQDRTNEPTLLGPALACVTCLLALANLPLVHTTASRTPLRCSPNSYPPSPPHSATRRGSAVCDVTENQPPDQLQLFFLLLTH